MDIDVEYHNGILIIMTEKYREMLVICHRNRQILFENHYDVENIFIWYVDKTW